MVNTANKLLYFPITVDSAFHIHIQTSKHSLQTKHVDLDQVRLSRVRGIGRARCNNAGKFEGEDGLGSPASAPNLPTRFSVGTRHN
jgi:hypothetical protein